MATTASIKISRAGQHDLPALAEINRLAYYRETVAQIAFVHWPDEVNMFNFLQARLAPSLSSADTHVFKAVDDATGDVVGFACWTLQKGTGETGSDAATRPSEPAPTDLPSFLNADFIVHSRRDAESMSEFMKGEEHYCLSGLAVAPGFQGKGVGSQLLRHCLRISDQAGLRTFLISFPGPHSLYLRFGFVDVDFRDTDLAFWDKNRLRGYGLYRQYAMVREAQKS